MNKEKTKVVTLRPKGNSKDISKEPEMKELKRMIRDGELDRHRTIEHLKPGGKLMNKVIGEIETIDLPKIKSKIVATLEEQKSGTWIFLRVIIRLDSVTS